ncbi:MAG TPA: hypothetical protein VLT79_02975 [Gemmatimonadales bacterium]|nr:hypothetical protein [Gemmatimonadales bacterium]
MTKSELLIVVVLLFTVLLRFAIILGVAYLLVPRGVTCPRCGLEMMPIRNIALDRILPLLQRRWCLDCGWNGVTRRVRPATTPPRAGAPRSQSKSGTS